jgi:hypothetical protein
VIRSARIFGAAAGFGSDAWACPKKTDANNHNAIPMESKYLNFMPAL